MNSWLAHLDTHLRAQYPELPPANQNEEALAPLGKFLPKPLPAALRDFLLWQPQGKELVFSWELPDCYGGHVLMVTEIQQMAASWRRPSPIGTLNWWSAQWLPFLGGESGSYLCIDQEGTFKNPPGSVILFHPEKAGRPAVFPSFEGWLRWVALCMEQRVGRVFQEEDKIDIVLGPKAARLYEELFPKYPIKASADLLGLSLLDQTLTMLRRHGLSMAPHIRLPQGLTQETLVKLLSDGLVREDGYDADSVRVIALWERGGVAGNQMLYLNLRPTLTGAVLVAILAMPENIADTIRAAQALVSQGELVGASRRFTEAAFLCHKAGMNEEALTLVQRALDLNRENKVAMQSMEALQNKGVKPEMEKIRPLLGHLWAVAPPAPAAQT